MVSSSPQDGLTQAPVLLRYVEAPYPPEALAAGREGTVILAIDLDVDGQVRRVEVIGSAGREFDVAALDAATGFEFSPAEAGELGRVPVRITYRYAFFLKRPEDSALTQTATPTAASSATSTATLREGRAGHEMTSLLLQHGVINFSGTIREAGTRKTVGLGAVELSISTTATNTRTSTDADAEGRFSFRDVPPGNHLVTVRAPLFLRYDTKELIQTNEALEVVYYVTREAKNPYEVVVRAKLPKKEVARRTLRFEDIERLPGTQGDAIRVIQNLPGVARTPFGLGLLIVRGAPPQDTGVFLDGHRMPILFHFGGIGGVTSVVNSRILEAIDFYPGGFGPDQGRVSAGAVELRSRFAETDRVHGEAVVDLAGASTFIEGPVTTNEEDGAFVLALRRSYVDGIFAAIVSLTDASVSIAPRYYDYQARYDRPLGSKKRHLTLFAYGSDDEFVLLGSGITVDGGGPSGTRSRTFFHRLNPRYTYRDGEDSELSISPILGVDYSNTQTTGDASGNALRILIRDYNAGLRVDGTARMSDHLKLRAGGEVLYFLFASDTELPALPPVKDFPGPISTDVPTRKDTATIPATLASLYGEIEMEVFERLTLWPGLRFDLYDFSAEPAPLLDRRLIDGRTIVGLDPRLTARFRATDALTFKGQAGIYRQPPLPPQIFLNADLPLQTVHQYSVGLEWDIIERLNLDVQGFLREGHDIPRGTGDTEVVDGRIRPVGFREEGESRSFGAEVLLKLEKRWDLFGWIAYTLSRSETRRVGDDYVPNFYFDQSHNLTALGSYELGLNWFISARFRYVTGGGLPVTGSRWYDADSDSYRRDTEGQRRSPSFHQLDLRIDKRWVYDEWYLEAYLDVQNVLNRENTEFFAPTFDFKNEVPIPSLPFFPLLGVKGVF